METAKSSSKTLTVLTSKETYASNVQKVFTAELMANAYKIIPFARQATLPMELAKHVTLVTLFLEEIVLWELIRIQIVKLSTERPASNASILTI